MVMSAIDKTPAFSSELNVYHILVAPIETWLAMLKKSNCNAIQANGHPVNEQGGPLSAIKVINAIDDNSAFGLRVPTTRLKTSLRINALYVMNM
jgi:hypothetical protein